MRRTPILLPINLREQSFSIKQALASGISRYSLKRLLKEGVIERLARGVYCVTGEDLSEEEQFRAAILRLGQPSAICGLSALAHYHLIDAIPKKIWVMVPFTKRTTHQDIKLLRTRNPEWNIGIEKQEGYSITTLERSVVDALARRTKTGTQIGIEALRHALDSKKTTLGKIMDTAVTLGVSHLIRPYIEPLA